MNTMIKETETLRKSILRLRSTTKPIIINEDPLREEYMQFILDKGPYAYFISFTLNSDYHKDYILNQINFLLKILSRKIFTNSYAIKLDGFLFLETSSLSARCSNHVHLLIKDDPKLSAKGSFEDLFHNSIPKVLAKRRGFLINQPEFSKNCINIQPVKRTPSLLVDYLTKEFKRDPNGNFVKFISPNGIQG